MVGKRKQTQRVGRPPLGPNEGKRMVINTRTTKEFHEKLVAATAASGRSLSQEIEARLERSFGEEENLRFAYSTIFGDEALHRVMMAMIIIIRSTEEEHGLPWREDPAAREEAAMFFKDLLDGEAGGLFKKGGQPGQPQSVVSDNVKKKIKTAASKLKPRRASKRAAA